MQNNFRFLDFCIYCVSSDCQTLKSQVFLLCLSISEVIEKCMTSTFSFIIRIFRMIFLDTPSQFVFFECHKQFYVCYVHHHIWSMGEELNEFWGDIVFPFLETTKVKDKKRDFKWSFSKQLAVWSKRSNDLVALRVHISPTWV